MSVRRTEVSSVRFEINARPASTSMEALQAKADDLNKDIDIVKKNIADLGNVSPEHEGLKSYQKQLDDLNKKLKDVQTTMKDYTRGVKAADELLKAYDAGNIESLSMKAIKAGQNGLKKRIENIKPETANEEELKAYRIITEVIRESQRVVDTFKTDARETIQILEQGGTVAESTLKKTRDGVRDLMQSTKEGSKENREYAQQFEFLAEKMKEMEAESARVSGQKMLGRAFRGDFATADKKTLEEVIAKLREYQSVIDDPNGKGARIMDATEKQIRKLSETLNEIKNNGALKLMNERMSNLGNLSKDALAETKRFWQSMYDGAEKNDPKLAEIEKRLKDINAEEQKRDKGQLQKDARLIKTADLSTVSEQELQASIRAAKQLAQAMDPADASYKQLVADIIRAEEHVEKFGLSGETSTQKQAQQLQQMTDRIGNLSSLSDAALQETKKFWEAQVAGTEKGKAELAEYEVRLKAVKDEEQERNRIANEQKAGIVRSESFNIYSLAEIRESIAAAKELHSHMASASPDAQRLAESIAKAEEHVKRYGGEAARVAQSNETMRRQFQTMIDELNRGIMPTASAIKAQQNYWRKLIEDPKTAKESLQEYRDQLKEVDKMQEAMVRINGETAFQWFQNGSYRDASTNKVKEMAADLKAYRDSLPQETAADRIKQIDHWLQKSGQSAKTAAEDVMSLDDALELAAKAGENYYLQNNKEGFVASPQQIQAATKAINERRDAVIKLIQENKRLGLSTEAEEEELQDLTKKLRDLKFEEDNVNMSQEKMRRLMEQPANAVSLDELRAAIKRADGELRRMEGSLGANSKEYKAFAEQVKQAKNVLKEMEGQSKATSSAWDKAWSRLKTYVGIYMGFNMLWQKMTGTMDDMMTLSDKMGEVRKTTGFTADEVGRLSDNLAKLDTRTNLTGLMEFSSLAGSIGLKTQEAVQGFTEAANMIAVSLPEMGNEASRTLMKIADATGDLEKNGGNVRETLERVGSTIIALRANSAAAAGPITDFVSRVGAVGAQAGISIDQIAALGATVDALGGRVEMSATALSRMIPAIKNNSFAVAQAIGMTEKELKGKTGMEQMVAIFRALHDSVKGFDTSTEEGMNAMADSVEKALGRSTSMQDVMKQLNQQGARAGIVFGLLSQNVDKLEEQLDTASDAYKKNTALLDEYNKMNDTTAARWERMKNTIEELLVSDSMQTLIGNIIKYGLRPLADMLAMDGPIGSFFRWSLVYLGLWKAKWAEAIGTALMSVGNYIASLTASKTVTAADAAAKTADAAATETLAVANKEAEVAAAKLNKTMKANIYAAVAMAVLWLGTKIIEYAKSAKSAAEEQKRLNEAVSEGTVEAQREVGHLNNVIKALDNAKMSEQGRMEVLNKFKSDYSQYIDALGIEIKTVQDLKDNYDQLTGAIRRAAFERVRDRFKEQELEPLIKEAVEQGTDLQTGTNGVLNAVVLNDAQKATAKYGKAVQELTAKNLENFRKSYRKEMTDLGLDPDKATIDQIKAASTPQATGRLTNQAIQRSPLSLTEYLAGKIDKGEIKDAVEAYKDIISKEFGKGEMFNATFDENLNYVMGRGALLTRQTGAVGGEKTSAFNEKLYNKIEKFVTAYTKYKERGDQIDAAFSPYVGNGVNGGGGLAEGNGNGGGGGGGTNPYGDYDKVKSAYSEWNGNDLVARRKEMLERVKALANGADVQAVLSEDAKFISDAVRKNIKTTEQAIEWYNTERLKIQEALHAKHLTNTGDWLDPKKGAKRASRVVQDEMKYYMDELDAYYTERKAKIQEAQNDEEISEAEARNRTLANEAEWRQRRAELQQLYANKSVKVAQAEQDAIFDILSDRTGESIKYIRQDIAQTVKFIEDVGKKSKAAMDRINGDLDKGTEQDFLRQRNAIGQHMKDITAIVNKENPYAGITEELRKNLGTMDALLTDIKDKEERTVDKEIERTMFILEQSTKGYSLTWEELMGEMAKRGWQAWADAIEGDTQTQQRLMHQVYRVFEKVQDAIKKEASELKKQADIMWSNILLPGGDGKTTIKDAFEQTIGALGIQEGRVSRANSLIGAGQASERVADKLAIQQMKVQLAMQRYQYDLVRKIGKEKIDTLRKEAEMDEAQGKRDEARSKRMQADNAEQALNLATRKEQTEELKMQEQIIARTEESQARLYKELREWGDLIASSLQSVMEASNAGNAEYYNELAKLNLTGKGGPGAGTYVVIDNAGTKDAKASYEYLDERAALEREHEIEQQNAQAEAWKKVMDDINQKLSDTITDQLNAMLQNASIDANTDAINLNIAAENSNTNALGLLNTSVTNLTSTILSKDAAYKSGGNGKTINGGDMGVDDSGVPVALQKPEEQEQPAGYGVSWMQPETEEWTSPWAAYADASTEATKTVTENNKKAVSSSKASFAAMTAAANMYGIAYQAMSNENLSTAQKVEMMIVQAAGQAAISMLSASLAASVGETAANAPAWISKTLKDLGPIGGPVAVGVFTALIGGLMGLAVSKIGKSKSQIAQATGASVGAGRLATGMLTYKEGNVDAFTDPASLTPGKSYNVDAADGKTYRAKYTGTNPRTHLTNGPEFHLAGEAGREMIIDAGTTRQITMNENEIWRAIQTLSSGGRLSHSGARRSGMRAFAEGNVDDFADYEEVTDGAGLGFDPVALQASLDRNSAVQEALLERLSQPIQAKFDVYGKGGLVDSYDTGKKTTQRHGVRY